MEDGASQNPGAEQMRMQTLLTAFRQVGMPLLQALTDARPGGAPGEAPQPVEPRLDQFGALVDITVVLARELSAQLGANENEVDAWIRWSLAGAAYARRLQSGSLGMYVGYLIGLVLVVLIAGRIGWLG